MIATDGGLPVNDELTVRKHETLYKSAKWWKAVAVTEGFNQTQVSVYLWKWDDDGWTRKQKLKITDADEWKRISETVASFLGELSD